MKDTLMAIRIRIINRVEIFSLALIFLSIVAFSDSNKQTKPVLMPAHILSPILINNWKAIDKLSDSAIVELNKLKKHLNHKK